MLNNIKPFYVPTNICLENIYVSLCNALKRKFINMYAYSWNFGYKPFVSNVEKNGVLFAFRITPSRDGEGINSEQVYAMEKYCGITPIWHMNCEHKNFRNIVKRELDNDRPVVIGTDVFYCQWHKLSDHVHTTHYCLIVGMDENGFVCIDDTLAGTGADGFLNLPEPPEYVTLAFDTLEKFKLGFLTFQISPHVSEYSSDDIIYLSALKTLTGFDGKSDFQNMRELLADIDQYLDIDKEVDGYENPATIGLIRCLNYFVWSRFNYMLFLNEKQKYKGRRIQVFSDTIDNSMNLWNKIRSYVAKYAVESEMEFNKDIVCNSLSEIIKIEEKLANDIVSLY